MLLGCLVPAVLPVGEVVVPVVVVVVGEPGVVAGEVVLPDPSAGGDVPVGRVVVEVSEGGRAI
jgi:hypothetical protein